MFCGIVVTPEGREKRTLVDFEPPRPLTRSLYLCDSKFHFDTIEELLEDKEKIGFIIVDGNGCLFATVCGGYRYILHKFSVDLPKKHGRGGQSALRFARLREEKRHNYVRKCSEIAANVFITENSCEIKGLVFAGSADFKTDLALSPLLDPRLRRLTIKTVDVAYGMEAGLNQAIESSRDCLAGMKLVREIEVLQSFFQEIARDTNRTCFLPTDTITALEMGALETLVVDEGLSTTRLTLKDSVTGAVRTVYRNAERNPKSAPEDLQAEVESSCSLVDYLVDNYSKFGAKLELVSDRSPEGSQFCRGFGGVGGVLRFAVDFGKAHFEDEDEKQWTDEWEDDDNEASFAGGGGGRVEDFLSLLPGASSACDDWEGLTGLASSDGDSNRSFPNKTACNSASSAGEAFASEVDPRQHLNVVFIGHVDAGKSTISGRILYATGVVDERTIQKFEREAVENHRDSWFLAYIMDTSAQEREKGKTVEVGRADFETAANRYTILDAPGHKNYVPDMIGGAAMADVGVLVVSARRGEFETGFENGGQTREHALLAKTLGVQYLVVAVNKMDDSTVGWSEARFEECVGKLKPFLKSCGYVIKSDVKFVPVSGLSGDNVLSEVAMSSCPWWRAMCSSGRHNSSVDTPTLLSTLDALRLVGREGAAELPLRIPCLDRYNHRGCQVMGKVESGAIRCGDEIVVAPTMKRTRVEAIVVGERSVESAKAGENVVLQISLNLEDIQKGFVLSCPRYLCPTATVVRVELLLVDALEHRPLFGPGFQAVFHAHTVAISATCMELLYITEGGAREVSASASAIGASRRAKVLFASTGMRCGVRLRLALPSCLETYASLPALGRFTLRAEGKTIATGRVEEIFL